MKTNKSRDRYFCTASLTLAVFLSAKQQQFTAIEPSDDPTRKAFVFQQTDQLLELVRLYKFGDRGDPDLMVEVHAYEQARRELLDRLYEK